MSEEENKDPQEENKDPQEENDERTYRLLVKLSLKPEGENVKPFSMVETEMPIPFLLDKDQLLLAEPRFRQLLDSVVESFTLKTSIEINKLIELNKDEDDQPVQNQGLGMSDIDELEIDE